MRFLAFLLVSLFIVSACNEDDAPSSTGIVGEWKIQSARSTYDEDNLFFGELYSRTEYISGDVFLDFKDDGTFTRSGTPLIYSLLVIQGDTSTNEQATVNFNSSGTYTVNDDQIQFVNLRAQGGPINPPDSSQVYDFNINGNLLEYNFIQDTFYVSPNSGDTLRFDTELLNSLTRN